MSSTKPVYDVLEMGDRALKNMYGQIKANGEAAVPNLCPSDPAELSQCDSCQ